MDRFYSELNAYNRRLVETGVSLPQWVPVDNNISPTWRAISTSLKGLNRDESCFEIGSGVGDIMAILAAHGFRNIHGIEREDWLVRLANQKLMDLFGVDNAVIHGTYPTKLTFMPTLLIQVNCIYRAGKETCQDYISRLQRWHSFNGIPHNFLVELIDGTFTAPHPAFPPEVRVHEECVRKAFLGFNVSSQPTYVFPQNTASKRLYSISLQNAEVRCSGGVC
ncbi:MAG TPA: hypothetical protein PKW95_23300 [bacterium]|nr:hypothetical protein [bacterium]